MVSLAIVQAGIAEAATAVALGGCLTQTVSVVLAFYTQGIDGSPLGYASVGLAGELVAMLGLVSLNLIHMCFSQNIMHLANYFV